jgi:hypothetical protein
MEQLEMKRLYYKPTDSNSLAWPFPSEEPVRLQKHFATFLPDGRLLCRQSLAFLAATANDASADVNLKQVCAELLEIRGVNRRQPES